MGENLLLQAHEEFQSDVGCAKYAYIHCHDTGFVSEPVLICIMMDPVLSC